MYIGFISYSFGDHYHWICKDWNEMYEFCKDDIGVLIPETEREIYFSYIKDIFDDEKFDKYGEPLEGFEFLDDAKNTWISISKASDYSINQAKIYFYSDQEK